MISELDLTTLLAQPESDRCERTESVNKTDKFAEAICAFANDLANHRLPGYLIIGARADGTLSGLQVTDELLLNLAAIRADGNVLPQPAMNVAKFSLAGGDVAVVEVLPADLPPVRYKGRVHVRVGPRQAVANEQEERILAERRGSSILTFDAQPCPEASLTDLGIGQFAAYRAEAVDAETIAANRRTIEEQLASLRFYEPLAARPTYAGILVFGRRPRYFLAGAYAQYLKFPGVSYVDLPQDQAEVLGDLPTVVLELAGRLKLLITTALVQVSMMQQKLQPDYPEAALRELLMNAIMHKNYQSTSPIRLYGFADRIEIQNAGGLYGEANRDNFPTRNTYRNPVIAEAMKSLGFVNRYGFGVQRAQELLAQNGNPPAVFEFDPHSVKVTVYKARLHSDPA